MRPARSPRLLRPEARWRPANSCKEILGILVGEVLRQRKARKEAQVFFRLAKNVSSLAR
jgi:hypothetical protein